MFDKSQYGIEGLVAVRGGGAQVSGGSADAIALLTLFCQITRRGPQTRCDMHSQECVRSARQCARSVHGNGDIPDFRPPRWQYNRIPEMRNVPISNPGLP
jgi:hypothetical protein